MPSARSRVFLLIFLLEARLLEGQGIPAPGFAASVDSVFASWRGSDRPGCVVGVSHEGRVLLERAYGMADIAGGVPMRPETMLHAASVAKQVTALAVLQLVRDGRVSLDDDVRRFVPELPDYGARITVRHLLNHTSGLRDFFELLILARGRFEEERITERDAMTMILRQRALNFPPGSQYGYNNTGYFLAAKVVERVSGKRFRDYVAARIAGPFGMTHSLVRDDVTRAVPGLATGYARSGTDWRIAAPNFDVVGSTNLETTVGDLLRWSARLDTLRADSALVGQMTTPTLLTGGDSALYGFGLSLQRDRGFDIVEHEGRDPGFRAYVGRIPAKQLAVALLCNTTAVNPVSLGRSVAWLALGAPASVSVATKPDEEAARAALKWAGVYLEPSTRQVAELSVRDGVLYTDRVGGARLEAVSANRARQLGAPIEIEFATGAPLSYRVRWSAPGRRSDTFVWKAAKAPSLKRSQLDAYAGNYRSTELDAAYRVDVRDSTITLRAGEAPPLVARAVYPDAFVSGQYTIQFVRSGAAVTGFEISHPRARGVFFFRAPD